jgi:hypothetical protein
MLNRLTGKYTSTVKITNTGAVALQGPLHLVLEGLTAGVTLDGKTGEQGGAPYLTLPNTSLAPGATASITTTFTNPSKITFGYTPKLFSGTF